MDVQTSSGVTLDELIQALSRLTSSGQRPADPRETKVIGHFTDLVAFLGRDNANVPFQFEDTTQLLAPPTPTPAIHAPDITPTKK
jgi:hypothetical protein